jgi:hypothetical protein
MSWAMQRPPALREASYPTLDALGHSKPMQAQTWAWLIGLTDETDSRLLEWAHSFSSPPSIEQLAGAQLESDSFAPERRAVRLIAEAPLVTLTLSPADVCVNPVFEIRNAPLRLLRVNLNDSPLDPENWAWDGKTLWLNATLRRPATLRLAFSE